MEPVDSAIGEDRRLRRIMRALASLSALPSLWSELDLDGIARNLADSLLDSLSLDLVFVRFHGRAGEAEVEEIRSRHALDAASIEAWRASLTPLLSESRAGTPASIADPLGTGSLRVAVTRAGQDADQCVLVTGARSADFPTDSDQMLLSLGANQAATAVSQRRLEDRLRQTEARSSAILETALDCIITIDHEGTVVEFNAAAEKTFGYHRAEAVGRELAGLIIPPALRERHRRGMAHYLATGEGSALGKRLELSALRADGAEFPVELAITQIPTEGPPLFTAYLRDISERRQRERHRNVRLMVSQVLAEAASVSDAAVGVLRAVCESIGWEVGLFWTLETSASRLECFATWQVPGVEIGAFEAASRQQTFQLGEGLPGSVWERGEPAWVLDVVEADNFPRAESAAAEGLHGAFACPLVVGGETVGVIEFFTRRIREPDPDLLETMATVAGLIAQFVQRKQADEALQRSRERLDMALHAADLGHWEMILSDHTISRDLRHDQIFGYDAQLPEWTYEALLAHVVPDHRQAVDASFQRALRQNEAWEVECRVRRADGDVRWIWLRGRPLAEGEGRAARMAGTVADITERKQIEEELRDARSRLDAALTAGAIVTWTWDIPNNRLFTDESLARMFSLAPAEAEGGLLDAYVQSIHPDDRDRVLASLREAVDRGEDYESDYRIVQRDGSIRWVTARGRAERDELGRPVRMPGVLVDITERKRLEDELRVRLASLRESEEKLRLLADTIPQLAWMARSDGHIFWFNRGWYEYTGTAPDEMEGWGWQSVHDPEVLPKVLERWKGAIASGDPFDMVFPLRGKDGRFRPFLTRVNPLRDDSGRVVYWCGTNTDISDIKRMEDALRDADRRKDEFLATLAHELRNPLAPIRNSLQILRMPRLDASTAQQTRDIMERQVHHLVRLVDDLLDVSRAMRGKIDLRKEAVELSTIVARAVETAQPLIDVQGHELEIDLPQESLLVNADPVRLSQVVGNLLLNAAKYTEPGGRISVSAQREGGAAVLRVRDDGIGIAPDVLPQVFELFVQVEQGTARSQGGLGIGLTLAKHLVEMHGGAIEAHSDGLAKGSEFVVRLPMLTRRVEEPSGARPQEEVASSGLRVLVVDDNEDAAMTLAVLLRLQGHDVQVVHDGVSALRAAEVFRPALIFVDLGMPEMDGFDVARQIRGVPGMERVVLAALTGWGQPQDRRRTAEAGFDHHLVKPAEPEVIAKLLRDLQRDRR